MASNVVLENGANTHRTQARDIKIMVVGEKKCGKSKFIRTFTEREGNRYGAVGGEDCARVYPCRYEAIDGTARDVTVLEIIDGPDRFVPFFTKRHLDTNAVVFLYAVDDPSSFEAIEKKWLPAIRDIQDFTKECILVGTKKDLRSDPQVIERLKNINQEPVSIAKGEELVAKEDRLVGYYDCSAMDENDRQIHEAFHDLVERGILDWYRDT